MNQPFSVDISSLLCIFPLAATPPHLTDAAFSAPADFSRPLSLHWPFKQTFTEIILFSVITLLL